MDVFDSDLGDALIGVLIFGFLIFVVLVLGGGREPDPSGRRALSVYVGAVSFLALFLALFASTAVVESITEKIKDERSSDEFSFEEGDVPGDEDLDDEFSFDEEGDDDVSENDRVIQGVVSSGLVLAAAALVLVFHTRRRREYVAAADFDGSAAWRTDRAYLYVVCFVAVVTFLLAASFGAYEVFRLAAPGVFASGDDSTARKEALQALLTLAWLALGAGAIFRYFWLQAHPRPRPVPEASPPA